MKDKISLKILLATMLFLCSLPVMAQFDDPDEDEDSEEAFLDPAPINDYIVPMLLAGVITGYYLMKKKDKASA